MMTTTTTLPKPTPYRYQIPQSVKCQGRHRGGQCLRLLGRNLEGSIEIKCPRCGHLQTYTAKPVDNEA
jgi:phage FluMu protein Com